MRILALAILAVAVSLPATAAAQPSCGDTITTDTTLSQGLSCNGTALNVQGNLTLDLAGNTVTATNGDAIFATDGTFTIRNGTVSGSRTGVNLGRGARATVRNITAERNDYGFRAQHVESVLFDRDDALHNTFDGFNATGFVGGPVSFSHNRAFWNGGLGINASPATDLGHNKGRHNGDPCQCVNVRC